MDTYKLNEVLKDEAEQLKARRKLLFGKAAADTFENDKFGIAMSGGGIRSATINLGFLKTLNLFKILEKADYLSTVSGGGYTGAYIQATVKELNGYEKLFDEEKIKRLQSYGNYLIPGQGKWEKLWNSVVLVIGFLVSWVMSLLSPATVVVMALILLKIVASLTFLDAEQSMLDLNNEGSVVMVILNPALWVLGSIILIHLVLNLLLNFNLGISKTLTKIESVLGLSIAFFLLFVGLITFDTSREWQGPEIWQSALLVIGLFVLGYFLNPNALSFHRYYRKQLSDAYLSHSIGFRNMLLRNVNVPDGSTGEKKDYMTPYPLINTCLNLQNPGGGEKFKGAKASDYFLLSPLYCGSKLSGFVRTADYPGYNKMTLPAAITISAAAANPGMGIYSNKALSVLMTLFNARLGFWVNNPLSEMKKGILAKTNFLVWWPAYFFKELLAKISTDNRKLNISDGGHIENLGVYELLRRNCRLIFSIDAGADPESTFSDLENLSIRARNELGIDIAFRPGQDPVDIIRPKPSSGYASRRFAMADLIRIWEEFIVLDESGQAVTFTKEIIVKGKPKPEEFKLEALVNYFYSNTDSSYLKFKVDLKAEKGLDIPVTKFDELMKQSIETVRRKLEERPGKPGIEKIKIGTLVYIKSSVTPPRKLFVPEYDHNGKKNPQFDTFKYKIYHPEFPQESTADQFFDPVQWESYYQLGQHIAADVLSIPRDLSTYQRGDEDLSLTALMAHFTNGARLFKKEGISADLHDAFPESSVAEHELSKPKRAEMAEAPIAESEIPLPEDVAEQMQFKI